jgi:hypothetical protein
VCDKELRFLPQARIHTGPLVPVTALHLLLRPRAGAE